MLLLQTMKYKSLSNIMFMAGCRIGLIYGFGSSQDQENEKNLAEPINLPRGMVFIILLRIKFIPILKNTKKIFSKKDNQQ